MRHAAPLIVGFALAVGAATPAAAQTAVPVMVGGSFDFDACSGTSRVTGLNPRGDNFLAVRSGPSTRYRQIDSLYSNDVVITCDFKGRWVGIVYGGGDCGVFTPVGPRQQYRGPCLTGWVFDRYLTELAG